MARKFTNHYDPVTGTADTGSDDSWGVMALIVLLVVAGVLIGLS